MGSALTSHDWDRIAAKRAASAMRKIIAAGTTISAGTPVGKLSDVEFGWLFSAALYEWISVRAEQAVAEGKSIDGVIQQHPAWHFGAIDAMLSELADADIDWKLPLADWSQDTMRDFLATAYGLMNLALERRDRAAGITHGKPPNHLAREANAAFGGPLAVGNELNDGVPPF